MSDKNKTKEQLIKELSELRKRVTELEKSESERNNVEEKQKKTEEQHKISTEFLSDGYLSVDLKGKITDCNSVFLNHIGYSREDIVNKRFTKLPTLRKKDIPQFIKMFNSAIRGKIQKPIEYEWIHRDGTTRWGEAYFGVTRKKRRISGFIIITRDITERKKTEEMLQESEEKYHSIFDSANEAIFIIDYDGNIKDVNKKAYEIYGYSYDEFLTINVQKLIHPDYYRVFIKNTKTRLKQKDFQAEAVNICKDGREISVSINISRLNFKGEKCFLNCITDITERKKTEEGIKEIKENYERIIDNADEAIFRVGARGGNVSYVNPAAERLLGYSLEEWISDHALGFKIILPDFVEKQKHIVEEINKYKKTIKNTVLGWKTKDGREILIEYTIIPILDDEGEIIYFESIGRDITERKKMEEVLLESEEKYRSLVESTADSIYLVDRDCRYLFINRENLKRFNLSADKVVGKKYRDFHSKKISEMFTKRINYVFRTSKSIMHEYRSQRDGKFFLRTYSPVLGHDGKPYAVNVISKDITELKKTEEELENIFILSPDMIAVCTTEGKFLKVNPSWEKVLGYTQKELLDLGWNKLVHPDDVEKTNKTVKKQLKGIHVINFTNRYKCKDGSYKILEWQATFAVKGIVYATARDITKRKQAEEAIEKYTFELQELSKQLMNVQEKERHRISRELHDEMGQVLTMMKLDLISIKSTLPPEQFSGIKEKWKELDSLTENMLERTHQMTLDLRPHMLDDLGLVSTLRWYVGSLSDKLDINIKLKAVNLEERLTPELEIALYRIVQEAFTNIVKHAEAKNVLLNIKRLKSSVKLIIGDDGIGFNLEEFENRRKKEHGVGLLGMRERASLLKGTCTVESNPGEGTRVEVNIPLR